MVKKSGGGGSTLDGVYGDSGQGKVAAAMVTEMAGVMALASLVTVEMVTVLVTEAALVTTVVSLVVIGVMTEAAMVAMVVV